MFQPSLARVDNARWRLSSRFPKDFQDHNGVGVDAIHNPPVLAFVGNPELVASSSDRRHRSRMGQAQILALLQPAEQISRFNPRDLGKGRRLDLAVKPDEGLLPRSHQWDKLCQI